MTRHNTKVIGSLEVRLKQVKTFIYDAESNADLSLIRDLNEQLYDLTDYLHAVKQCKNDNPTHYYGTHTDNRVFGDDWSEVNTIIEWKCCEQCTYIMCEFQYSQDRMTRAMTGQTSYRPESGKLAGADILTVKLCPQCYSDDLRKANNKFLGDFLVCQDCTLQIRDGDKLETYEKIIKYRAQTRAQAFDSDEMRINSEWLS